MTDALRCRHTGQVVRGPFVAWEEADVDWDENECPECGSSGADECTTMDGDGLGSFVHVAREGANGQ